MTKLNEKAVGTKLCNDDLDTLEQLAALSRTSVSSLVRIAVQDYIKNFHYRLHPLSLPVATSLAAVLNAEYQDLTKNAAHLTNQEAFNNSGGVYLLIYPDSRKLYVGSTTELNARMTTPHQQEHHEPEQPRYPLEVQLLMLVSLHKHLHLW